MKIETDAANPDHSPTTKGIAFQVIMICIEATLDPRTNIDAATTEVAHDDFAQTTEGTATYPTVTHHTGHIADHPYIAVLCVINPEITVDHTEDHPTDLQGMNHADQIHTPAGQEESHIPRRT